MQEQRDTSDDVPVLSAVRHSPYEGVERLHSSRAREYISSQAIGVGMAIGAVGLARRFAPGTMRHLADFIAERGAVYWKNETPGYIHKQANRLADYGIMFSTGLLSTASTQVILARQRRNGYDYGNEITTGRDFQRVMAGWGIGFFGASTAVWLGDRYFRKNSSHCVKDILNQAESLLDKQLLNKWEFAEGRKLSEALVANGSMLVGGAPASVIGQRLYDTVVDQPAREPNRA